jgi:hypothetical protein
MIAFTTHHFCFCLLLLQVFIRHNSAPNMTTLHQYHIVGRRQPTEADPNPQIYRMRLFAPSEVVAKSRFWYVHCLHAQYRCGYSFFALLSTDAQVLLASAARKSLTSRIFCCA